MSAWRIGGHDRDPGNPLAIRKAPPLDELRRAGAHAVADKLAAALRLRDEYVAVGTELAGAPVRLKQARQADAARHAEQLQRDPQATLKTTAVDREQRRTAELQTRREGLATAVATAMDAVVLALADDGPRADARLQERRTETLGQLAAVTTAVRTIVGELSDAASAQAWLEHWPQHWGYRLTSIELRVGRHTLTVGELLDGLDALSIAIDDARLPGEPELPPEPTGFAIQLPS